MQTFPLKILLLILSPRGVDETLFESGVVSYPSSYDGRYAEHQGSGFILETKKDQKDTIWICLSLRLDLEIANKEHL